MAASRRFAKPSSPSRDPRQQFIGFLNQQPGLDDRSLRMSSRSGVGEVNFIEPLSEIVHSKTPRAAFWREA